MPDPEYRPDQPSLEGVRLKLDRAEGKLDRLTDEVSAYNKGGFHSVPDEPEQQGEWFIARVNIAKPPDRQWGLLVSEFLHLTRSALDNLVWQLVLVNEREPWCKNQFPIYTKRVPSKGRLDEMLRGVDPDHRAFIEEMQPYQGWHIHRRPKAALSRLVDLSNTDKHRYLHPALAIIDPQKIMEVAVTCSHPILDHRFSAGLLYDGAEFFALRTSPEAQVRMEGELVFDVAFSDPQATPALLEGIHGEITRIVERFSSAF